jgi:hypothetical protein
MNLLPHVAPTFFSLALCSLASAQVVHNISGPAPQTFTNLQAAVGTAAPGDVLLVAEGDYGSVIIHREISIFAMPGADVEINGALLVSHVPNGERAVISGIDVNMFNLSQGPPLLLQDNHGTVLFQDCEFRADHGYFQLDCNSIDNGDAGAVVIDSDRVSFASCLFVGGEGDRSDDLCSNDYGDGGMGVYCVNSAVAFYDCTLYGGQAGDGNPFVNWALDLFGSTVYAAGTGFGWPSALAGPGVRANGTSSLFHRDCDFATSPPFGGTGANNALPGLARELTTPTLTSWANPGASDYVGVAADKLWVLASLSSEFRWLLPAGIQQVSVTLPLPALSGVVPGSGLLSPAIDLSYLTQPSVPAPVILQAFALGGGSRWLSGVRSSLPLDPGSGPDCNNNGINDYLDIAAGTSTDANLDLAPDECP